MDIIAYIEPKVDSIDNKQELQNILQRLKITDSKKIINLSLVNSIIYFSNQAKKSFQSLQQETPNAVV